MACVLSVLATGTPDAIEIPDVKRVPCVETLPLALSAVKSGPIETTAPSSPSAPVPSVVALVHRVTMFFVPVSAVAGAAPLALRTPSSTPTLRSLTSASAVTSSVAARTLFAASMSVASTFPPTLRRDPGMGAAPMLTLTPSS